MVTVQKWTGRESRALREAMRLSTRGFAERLGINDRNVSKWESGTIPGNEAQAMLDTMLGKASPDELARFELFLTDGPAEANEAVSGGEGKAARMPYAKTSVRGEKRKLREQMRAEGLDYRQIAAEFSRLYKLRPRAAWREAYGWSLQEAADKVNEFRGNTGLDPAGLSGMTAAHLCEYENWPGYGETPTGRRPSPYLIAVLSAIYDCQVSDLIDRADRKYLTKADLLIVDTYTRRSAPAAKIETVAIPGRILTPGDPEKAAWEVSELMQRLERSDVGPANIQLLVETVNRLSSDYGREPANSLHPVIREWIGRISQAMDRRMTLAQHRDLLVCAGWLFLLSGCVEYDMGWKAAAETSRIAALQIGRETGHGEIQAWSWEMAAWFALTQGRTSDVAALVDVGQRIGDVHSVVVQLDAQLARAGARMGDSALVKGALESGYTKLSRMPKPDNPRNHFVVDPDKWDFYAMDAYRLLGDDARATAHAKEVLRLGQGADGRELAPMRMAEARLTLGVSAARSGELEEAVTVGESAFNAERKSLPTLLMVAGELKGELVARFPRESPTRDYCEKLTELTQVYTPRLEL